MAVAADHDRIPLAEVPGVGQCSRLVLGTMSLTPERMDAARELLGGYLAAGGNCLDTAFVYGGGASESAIGRWLRERGERGRVRILGKGAHHDASGPRVTPAAIAADLATSLQRLQVDAIDLYMLHRDDGRVPVGPIVEALNEHLAAGRIGAFGASNWSPGRIDEANAYAAQRGLHGMVASSPNFSLAVPNEARWPGCVSVVSRADREWYARRRMPLFSWSSQAGGFFTGRFAPDRREDADMVRVYYSADNWERLRRAESLAAERGATANQVALAYVLHQPFPTLALIGPLNGAELRSSLGALRLRLTQEEVAWLNLERDSP